MSVEYKISHICDILYTYIQVQDITHINSEMDQDYFFIAHLLTSLLLWEELKSSSVVNFSHISSTSLQQWFACMFPEAYYFPETLTFAICLGAGADLTFVDLKF